MKVIRFGKKEIVVSLFIEDLIPHVEIIRNNYGFLAKLVETKAIYKN